MEIRTDRNYLKGIIVEVKSVTDPSRRFRLYVHNAVIPSLQEGELSTPPRALLSRMRGETYDVKRAIIVNSRVLIYGGEDGGMIFGGLEIPEGLRDPILALIGLPESKRTVCCSNLAS